MAMPIVVLIGVKGQQVLYPIRFGLPFESGIAVFTAAIVKRTLRKIMITAKALIVLFPFFIF